MVYILKSLYHGGNRLGSVSAWYAEDGIRISHGRSASNDKSAQIVSWQAAKQFITEDEIDTAMTRGSVFFGGKGRIYTFFQEEYTDKEKVNFLKREYGIGGRSYALSGATHSGEDHDGKGLHYKKQDCIGLGGLLDDGEKENLSRRYRDGEDNIQIAGYLAETYAGTADTMELQTGDTADYFGTNPICPTTS